MVVIEYNTKKVKPFKGSAIFIHVARKYYKDTAGCIAVSKKNLKNIIKKIDKKTVVRIN